MKKNYENLTVEELRKLTEQFEKYGNTTLYSILQNIIIELKCREICNVQ